MVGLDMSAQGAIYDAVVGGKAQGFGMAVAQYLQLARIACNDDITANLPTVPPSRVSRGHHNTVNHPLIAATYAAQRYQPPSLPRLPHKVPCHPIPKLSARVPSHFKIKRRRVIPGHGNSFDRHTLP